MNKRHVTLKQVASSAGVSYQTVSKVLNRQIQVTKETENRIWEAARTLGYRPSFIARSLRAQRAFTIGYSWPPSSPDRENIILDQSMVGKLVIANGNIFVTGRFENNIACIRNDLLFVTFK